MHWFYSKCVDIIEFSFQGCLPEFGTEERGERSRVGEEQKSLPTPACLGSEVHLFMHFVLTHCSADFSGAVAHTDPTLRSPVGGRLLCCLYSGHTDLR